MKDGVLYADKTTKGGQLMNIQELLEKYSEMIEGIGHMGQQENEEILEFTKIIYSILDDFKEEIKKLQ